MTHSRLISLFIGCSLLSSPCFSESEPTETDPRWYQIEVLAFGRYGSESEELWSSNLALGYPTNTVNLIEETLPEGNEDSAEESNPEDTSTEMANLESDSGSETSPSNELTAFKVLPESELHLLEQANKLDRKNKYRVLFHKAWRQPAQSASEAPDVVITGGDQFDQHFELEGSVQLSVSRYLHLRTNLWLSQFSINYGQSYNKWPSLPEVPKAPEPIAIDSEASLGGSWNLDEPLTDSESSTPISSEFNLDDELNFDSTMTIDTDTTSIAEAEMLYVPSRIVTIEQKPRMRSGETHYIDHPLGGLIVRVTQVEQEKPIDE